MSMLSSRILVAVSLALNILIVGAAAGAGVMWYWTPQPKPQLAPRGLQLAAEDLSAEQRQAFRTLLAEARRDMRPQTQQGRLARDDLARLLVQDQLDLAAIDARLVEIRSADMVLRTRLEQAVVSFAETLSPTDRAKLVEGLQRRGRMLRRAPRRKN
jgi:uncharacterized membrane protein